MIRSIFVLALLLSLPSQAKTIVNYYKCVTERGTVYSQFPCAGNATQHTLTNVDPKSGMTSEQHYKTLNNLEKQQIIRNLKNELRAKKHEAAILTRERDQDTRNQQLRVNRIMDDKERKETLDDIKRQLKAINKVYHKQAKKLNKQIAQLERKLKRYE
ncbi:MULTISPECIES: hypothetical protein [Pseudoalteromonas]|uniref:DUF4124 domain-containing protein n=1 Tax=Pseudoalteromonas amylolytica TaxID=1859457 RepID=A0A1S1MYP6_9GAMM|nr:MULTISPECIES: hypothetical protein [Pseudoalteromonas]MCF6435255.1 DUF4124 domain-containing protein [Pseudoalteromonas sp. MMG022]OHU87854.1 hypothetical protein BFC16_10605 [Pseudoalteromonas sp. JW3]OHU91294.1 hypothetical protein BET10_10725 [Pseudoalteromonas amylolytica]